MKNKCNVIFSAVILTMLFLPAIRLNRTETVSEKENRTLAPRPFLLKDGRINRQYFSEYDSCLNDRFGFRKELIQLNSFVQRHLLGEKIFNSTALQGKNGWFFYISSGDGNNLNDFYKKNLLTESQQEAMRQRAKDIIRWCSENNIKPLFIIGPNKHSVYPEHYPFCRPEGITRADQIAQILSSVQADFIFPRDELLKRKSDTNLPLYYETDTHWNSLGAYYASLLAIEKIKNLFPECSFPQTEYEQSVSFNTQTGDILPMLSIENAKSTAISFAPKGETAELYEYIKNEGTNGVQTKGKNTQLPKALVFRDSFYSALEPFLSPLFSESECKWKQFREEDKKDILEYKPDIIIFEAVERYAPGLFS